MVMLVMMLFFCFCAAVGTIFVVMMVVMLVVFGLAALGLTQRPLHFPNPSRRSGHLVETEQMRVENFIQFDVGVRSFNNFRLGLQSADVGFGFGQLLGANQIGLVQQHDVAEFNLFHHQSLQIFFQRTLQTQSIYHGNDTIEVRITLSGRLHLRNAANILCDRSWHTQTAGFQNDVIELLCVKFVQLINQVHLQRATNTTIFQRHQIALFLIHHAAFLYQVGIDVHFADVVHHHGKFDALAIAQNAVYQGCFSAAQKSRQQQYRSIFRVHKFR